MSINKDETSLMRNRDVVDLSSRAQTICLITSMRNKIHDIFSTALSSSKGIVDVWSDGVWKPEDSFISFWWSSLISSNKKAFKIIISWFWDVSQTMACPGSAAFCLTSFHSNHYISDDNLSSSSLATTRYFTPTEDKFKGLNLPWKSR